MQTTGNVGADQFAEPRLYVHVYVFELLAPDKTTLFKFDADLLESVNEGFGVLGGDQTGFAQHGRVGDAAVYVFEGDVLVIFDRTAEGFDEGIGWLGETAAPRFVAHAGDARGAAVPSQTPWG